MSSFEDYQPGDEVVSESDYALEEIRSGMHGTVTEVIPLTGTVRVLFPEAMPNPLAYLVSSYDGYQMLPDEIRKVEGDGPA